MRNPHVSVFPSATNATPIENLTLWRVLKDIRIGTHRQPVEVVRQQLTISPEAYREAKKGLKAFTPAGTFAQRANTKLLTPSGLAHYDLDHVDDVEHAKSMLKQDPHVLYAFVSPSGEGLKFAVHAEGIADDPSYKHVWQTVLAYLEQQYPALAVNTDTGCKDIARLCFISFDPTMYFNPDAQVFAVPQYTPLAPRPKPAPKPFTASSDEHARAEAALRCIPSDDREIWLKMGMALHASGESWARDLWDSWSVTSEKFNERDQEHTWRSFKLEGGISMGTLFEEAKRHGYQPERRNGQHATPKMHEHRNGYATVKTSFESQDKAEQISNNDGVIACAVPYSDVWNAERLVKAHGQDLRYVYAWKKWLVWNGAHWEVDGHGAAMQLARDTIKSLLPDACAWLEQAALKAAMGEGNEEMKKAQARYAHLAGSLRDGRLTAMLSQAQSLDGIPVKPEALDRDPWLLTCANGTLDLRTATLQPHNREDLHTRCLDVAFDAAAQCPTWEAFLVRIMDGNENLIGFLQRAIGYALTGVIREHVLPILWGKGRNGKSTFLNTIRALLGPYAMKAPSELLMVSNSDRHPTERADLYGKRFVAAIETEQGRRLAEVFVKEATGGDPIRARRMREDFWEFEPTHKVFLATNHKPTIKGTDNAIWERIKLVPFTITIPPEAIDTALPEKLQAELPGILNWAVQGCLDWQAGGLRYPNEVKEFTAGYREEMDVLGQFIADCCLVGESYRVKASELYDAYKEWCGQNGEHVEVQRAWGMALAERGLENGKVKGRSWWKGIALLQDEIEEQVF